VSEDLDRRLAAAGERVRELSSDLRSDTMQAWREALQGQLQAERDLAAARSEQYATVIDIGPRWDVGAPLPHLISNGSRAFVVCLASQYDPDWDGTYVRVVSPADPQPSPFVVIEMWGCAEIRFGGPNDEAIRGHPLYGKGLAGYQAHEVVNSAWIEEAIKVNSVHPYRSDAPFRQLHHYALLFHDEMLEALAWDIESRLVKGTMGMILEDLADSLIKQPYRAGLPGGADDGCEVRAQGIGRFVRKEGPGLAVIPGRQERADPLHPLGFLGNRDDPVIGVAGNGFTGQADLD
jgi:hypothetical protein